MIKVRMGLALYMCDLLMASIGVTQAKVGHIEELSASLQVLRGKDFNITNEIMDIQVSSMNLIPSSL